MRPKHNLIPNQHRKAESLFQTWLILPETHSEIYSELQKIDINLATIFNETVAPRPKEVVKEMEEDAVPPRSPNRRRKLSEEQYLVPREVLKTDSGVDLGLSLVNHKVEIPRFHFPYGKSTRKSVDLDRVKALFTRDLTQQEFVAVTLELGLSRYLNACLFNKCKLTSDKVSLASFTKYWHSINHSQHSEDSLAFEIIKNGRIIMPADIAVSINGKDLTDLDVTTNHPGLEFLSNLPIFQLRYSETVLARLFYSKKHNSRPGMTLSEFRESRYTTFLHNLSLADDVNQTQDIFSYQHFYVIYCKFWELDRDHDMIINLASLLRYDSGTMTPAILSRVMSGCGKPLVKGPKSGLMTYEDFIWFIISVEDKTTPQACEYWFRCVDLDGDGVISLYEIQKFFEDQHDRMCSRMSDTWRFEDYVCSLMDLIRPATPNQIRLSDLKKSKCAPMFFDMLFDLRKYDGHIRRIDPMFREMDEVYVDGIDGVRIKLEGFQKFAARAYMILAEEESQGNAYSDSSTDTYDRLDSEFDNVTGMDWEVEDDEILPS